MIHNMRENKEKTIKKGNKFVLLLIISGFVISVLCMSVYGNLFQNQKNLKIGTTYMTMNNDFYKVVNDEIEQDLDEDETLIVRDPALDEEKQEEQIRDMADEGVNVLIINPVDSKKEGDAIRYAKEKGVYIIAIDVPFEDESLADCTIVSDNYQAGVQCAQEMMKDNAFGGILLLEHSEVNSAVDRIRGFKDTIAKQPQYHISAELECKGQTELSYQSVREYLSSHSDFNIVMALNDPSALGAVAAMEENDYPCQGVYSVDGAPEIKKLIGKGKYRNATAAQSPHTIAEEAVKAAKALTAGESYEKMAQSQNLLI